MTSADETQLSAVVAIIIETLGDAIIGAYQYGSAVSSGLRSGSDLDVFVLVNRPTTVGERSQLVTEIMAVSGSKGTRHAGRPVELTVAAHAELVPWRNGPRREFQYGEWRRDEYEAGLVPEPILDHDLAPLVATMLSASRPILGPPAADILEPVPPNDLVASMQQALPNLVADLEDDTVNVMLTLARMAYTTRCGDIVSKDQAALWAIGELPPGAKQPVSLARLHYLGQADHRDAIRRDSELQVCVEELAAIITSG